MMDSSKNESANTAVFAGGEQGPLSSSCDAVVECGNTREGLHKSLRLRRHSGRALASDVRQTDDIVVWSSEQNYDTGVFAQGAVAYDPATNTVTLTDFVRPDTVLVARSLGEDFTVRVVGDNALQGILSSSNGSGNASVNIAGAGSLAINENRKSVNAIWIDGEGSASKFAADPGVKLALYSNCDIVVVKNTAIQPGGHVVSMEGLPSAGANRLRVYVNNAYADVQYKYVDAWIARQDGIADDRAGAVGEQLATLYAVRDEATGRSYLADCAWSFGEQEELQRRWWTVYAEQDKAPDGLPRAMVLAENVPDAVDENCVACPKGYTRVYAYELRPESYTYWLSMFEFVQLPDSAGGVQQGIL